MEKEGKGVEKEEKGVEEGEGREWRRRRREWRRRRREWRRRRREWKKEREGGMEMRGIFQSRAYQLVAIMLHGVTVPMPSPSHMSCCPFTRGP